MEKAFGFSLPQVKRWAVACLGRDPEADYAGGAHREYSLDDAYKIFIMGRLVTEYRFVLKKAKDHIDNIWPILAEESLLPSQNWGKEATNPRAYLTIFNADPPAYELERVLRSEEIKTADGKTEYVRSSEIRRWPQGCKVAISTPQYILPIYGLLEILFPVLKGLRNS